MANRSDRNSKLPRRLKRQLTLNSTGNKAYDREIRKILMAAHAHAVEISNSRLRAKTNVDSENEIDE